MRRKEAFRNEEMKDVREQGHMQDRDKLRHTGEEDLTTLESGGFEIGQKTMGDKDNQVEMRDTRNECRTDKL